MLTLGEADQFTRPEEEDADDDALSGINIGDAIERVNTAMSILRDVRWGDYRTSRELTNGEVAWVIERI